MVGSPVSVDRGVEFCMCFPDATRWKGTEKEFTELARQESKTPIASVGIWDL